VNKNPTDATVCRHLFTAKLLYMFRVSQHPSWVLNTVTAASGTGHTTCTATPLQCGLIWMAVPIRPHCILLHLLDFYSHRTLHVWTVSLLHPDPASKQSAKPVWHIPIAVCTVLDSWRWTEKLSQTCRVLFQK